MSRYTDYDGYWLFGLIVDNLNELEFDLLDTASRQPETAIGSAKLSAVKAFRDQALKAGLVLHFVKRAELRITKQADTVDGVVNGRICKGHKVHFLARAIMDNGREYRRERAVFVAPHNADIESRSARAS